MKEIYAYARTEMFKTNGFTAIAVSNGDNGEEAEKTYAGGTIHIGNIHANELSAFLNFVESITEEYEEHLNIHIAGISQGLKKLLSCNDKNKNLLFADYLASGGDGSNPLNKEVVVKPHSGSHFTKTGSSSPSFSIRSKSRTSKNSKANSMSLTTGTFSDFRQR